ncbi:ABC transporter ATP-binding protein [Rhodococcus fascians]|jgi:putative ABC transport system ATP-binding protein|uniref:Lipoprotein-releasing system ATP-binding protein LolD n=1 Tax=Rhodococcoides fascians TaxID=1828 RepID=A0A143QNM1_RHOFA|nr:MULTISPECIES: ABC transporter ATP-binding protein [Rhodococcus]AMY24007.1 Lipoprotein-releasing system ATP-binding protein LolD [Rhodococcus fascians]KJV00496.1 ABC transporter ATPase [Rhodococcus sp. PML026]MBJ7350121.1 ABC transporter ATP-binding protein [Rhodococcus sp. (in: high G+C Gram-positive bacteria)]MBW4779164.1 ABC transporter ATP-binding protein [Rhodococcus fascians]MBX5329611.1 ABC transporter ATP-binding protein [Rhodococcus fascians]
MTKLKLQLSGVVKEYPTGEQPVRALDGIDLTIDGGQFVSLVAPSGAGKSTLLHMLGALDTPTAGSIRFNDVEVTTLDDNAQSDFRRHQVGFVFQFFNLLPTMSAWENVAVPKLLDGTPIKKAKADAMRLLDMVGLAQRSEHRPAQLSGGQIQRIAIARALMMDPALLIADEPTGNLDSKTSHNVLEILADVAHGSEGRRAVVMATHDLEAARSTDRVVSMIDGRVDTDTAGTPR